MPWSPYDVDGRNYDWAGLGKAADMLFVMAYDTQSQVRGGAQAAAAAGARGDHDRVGLGEAADMLFVMACDTQSQVGRWG